MKNEDLKSVVNGSLKLRALRMVSYILGFALGGAILVGVGFIDTASFISLFVGLVFGFGARELYG